MKIILKIIRFVICILVTIITGITAILLMLFMKPHDLWEFLFSKFPAGMLFILNIKYKVSGQENLQGPAIFIMNHQGFADIFLLPVIAPCTTTVIAKKEIRRIPIVAQIMKAGNSIFVDRQNPKKAIQSIREGLKVLPKNYSLLIFPEGTRSTDFKLKAFKKGVAHIALQTGLPVVPIGLAGMEKIGGGKSILMNPGTVYIHAEKPIDTSRWSVEQINQHVSQMHEAVSLCVEKAKKMGK